ncbi:PREDICTED: cadherin-86C [Ceratosolen solmsi marchali]|uniref:Cadherin-86C n=1 Tax=Ceratosolen solmsi marchali TaxID=326594 RepID=A0AAJ7DXF9_9HYME|nr:PREDICTED: cadherin-86C [Ceratosolen solmsi marchali]
MSDIDHGMQIGEEWLKTWICLSFLFAWVRAARPRFDVSTDMGMVLVPADAEVDTVIFRLRATDQDTDFPLIFEIIGTTTSPIVRVENLPCTLYNKVCQANVILTRRLVAGRLHDFVVRVRDSKGDVNSMQATISVTNSTTPRDKIFPHVPSLIMVPEDTKPEKELDYLLVESNPWSGKPVYIELWQPKELFKIRQRQMGSQTKGIITLIGELDFETQSMYTLTMYATDPYTQPGKDTRNIAGLHVVVIVQDVQDVPPVFTLAPPLTKINNSIKSGDLILRVHAEDGDKGVPREVTYGLISEGNPFTPFFNVSETTGEIILVKPLEELTKITHVGAPIVLKIVAEEIRSTRDEPPAQATVVELGLLLGEPVNSPPYFENDNYIARLNENAEPGTMINFSDDYSTRVKDEDIGKAGVFALKLENNNGTFEISPTVAERNANFFIMVRDNTFIDYEKSTTLRFKIVAQEVGPATNLSTSVPVTIFLSDVNDNNPSFDSPVYNVTLSENTNAGTRVVQVHATDKDTGDLGKIQYTKIIGDGSEAFVMNPENGVVTVSMGTVLDRELTPRLELIVEARDEDGRGLRGTATLIVNILDVNDNPPLFEKGIYEFLLNSELTNFTAPAFIKALDTDTESPNNIVQYEIVHGNYENKFQLNEITGELMVCEGINKSRKEDLDLQNQNRSRRAEDNNPLFILTARAYDLGVPHLSTTTQIRIIQPMSAFARIVMFVMPGENPDPRKTAETLATITGSRVIIQEIKPYISQINPSSSSDIGKRSVVVARVEQNGPGTLVDVDKIRASLTANGFGIISGMDNVGADNIASQATNDNTSISYTGRNNTKNNSIIDSTTEDVTVYKAENKLLTWLLVICGLLLLAAIITLIICCICPNCPFYMEPRKRRIHSSETLLVHSDGRPKRHLHRKPMKVADGYYAERKEAWSADPERHYWQFNRRNTKNLGIASLPGDIAPGYRNPEIERLRRAASLRLRDDVSANQIAPFTEQVLLRTRATTLAPPSERIYVEDVETVNRDYEQEELESFRKHELERDSMGVPSNEAIQPGHERLREQHFYRDGNAEVLRLITRGDIEDHKNFADVALKTDIQRLIVGHNYKSKDFNDNGSDEYRSRGVLKASMRDEELATGEMTKGPDKAAYVMHDVELVRQNALLTRLLLEKEAKGLNVPIIDSSSFLETQSLPGHVAIATQTDRTTATQTEFFGRSRSDNEELEEDQRIRRKSKQKERVETKEDFKKLKTIWVRTPIPEEIRTQSGNKISTPTRTKIEVTESCKVSISPDALKEISSSLKSSESGGNEEDDDEVLGKGTKVKPDLMQKVHKLTSKAVCLSKKKVKETKADNDSTTASPEVKEKNTLLKSKIRKKMEKTPKSKKLEKNMEFEKNNFMEPSFRILEKEISSFQKKIREFGDKKLKIIKRDSDKTDKECKSDDGPAYDLSKKCEITVKQIKKNFSKQKQTNAPKKQKSQSLEKKSIRNQRLTTNLLNRQSGIVEMKKKVPSLESKTIEELRKRMMKRDEKLDINKTSTSDDSKATSPSKTETSTVVDFDKLVEEVNDAAEKEISLLTQVTQKIINGKKTDDTKLSSSI